MSLIRPIVAFLICLLISLAILDVSILMPDTIAGEGLGDFQQLIGTSVLVNIFAAPVIAFGGVLGGFFVLTGNRANGKSRHMSWIALRGALAGAIYGALVFVILTQSVLALVIGACAGLVAGAVSGAIWCALVERPRHA